MIDDKKATKRFRRLLIFLLAYLFISPFLPTNTTATILIQGWLSIMLFFAANAVQKHNNQRSLALGVMAVSLILHWLGIFEVLPYSATGAMVLFIIFYSFLIVAFTKQLLLSKQVSGGVIMASLCLYLVIGLLWGSAYALIAVLHEGAFSGALLENAATSEIHLYNYFSMVTLTTLGYGDITPQIPEAASLCQMEAIVGQFYTAVLVAWLVGMYGKPMGRQNDPCATSSDSPEAL